MGFFIKYSSSPSILTPLAPGSILIFTESNFTYKQIFDHILENGYNVYIGGSTIRNLISGDSLYSNIEQLTHRIGLSSEKKLFYSIMPYIRPILNCTFSYNYLKSFFREEID